MTTGTTITLSVNGEPKQVPASAGGEPLSVSGLLELMKIDRAQVAVEVNASVVKRAEHAVHALKDGDQVEIVTFVGGG